jgi:hypothetical protein
MSTDNSLLVCAHLFQSYTILGSYSFMLFH